LLQEPYHSLALKRDGTLWAWGYNSSGQLGLGNTTNRSTPTQVGTSTDWIAIAAGGYHSLALKRDGTLWVWGRNDFGQLGLGDTTNRSTPTQVGTSTDWIAIAAGGYHSLALKRDGTLWAWGRNDFGQLGFPFTRPHLVNQDTDWSIATSTITSTISVSNHFMALKQNGTLWAWGNNSSGQLGLGNTTNRSTPTQVGTSTDWIAIAAGDSHSLALKRDGTLWAWGYNYYGQLGLGDYNNRSTPTQVGTSTDWIAIAAGDFHSLALKRDGTLWAWGYNYYGQLGLGNTTNRSTPTQVGTSTDWIAIAAGAFHSLALKRDGTLWAWGYNSSGQLGLGNTTNRSTPTQVGTSTDWIAIAAGGYHSLALKRDGTLWVWGSNGYGQLGLGDTTNRSTPTQVGTSTDWIAIAAGDYHSLALKRDGTLWVWGRNNFGQLGLGDTTNRNTPTQVDTSTDWIAVDGGSQNTLGVKSNGTLWVWGIEFLLVQVGTDVNWGQIVYYPSGTFTSSIIDTNFNLRFGTLNFSASTTPVTTIKFQLRSGNSTSTLLSKDFVGPDGSTSTYYTLSGTQIWSGHNGDRYIQYKAYLETTNTSQTPYLNDITINYEFYPFSANLISSPYDTSDNLNIVGGISWNEDVPTGTGVIVSLRSASSSSLLDSSPWFDFTSTTTGCTKNATTVICSSSAIPLSLKDGAGDRFVQYKVTLNSDGINAPTFDNFSLTYVVNAPPEFDNSFGTQGISAFQVSDPQDLLWGRVKIQYSIRDPDTTQGSVTPGYITPRFQYSLDNGNTWNDITSTYLRDGDLSNKAVQEVNYTTYDAIWDVKAQIPNVYTNNLLLKVIINDNEGANNLAFRTATLTIDTKPPERGSPPFSINADKVPVELKISANDDNSIQMKIGLQPDLSDANWENYATLKTISLATDTTATVYYQFRDAYNNVTDIFSATTPEKPKAFIIQDTSNLYASPVKYSLYLDWQEIPEPTTSPFKQYNVLRSTDGTNFTQIATIANKNFSYFTDATVVPNTLYYYKVTAQDQHNNISFSSKIIRAMANGIQDYDEGGGGSLPPLPKIQFSTNNSSGLENVTPVNIEIVLSTTTSENVSVNYAVTGGSATYSADYTITIGATGTITIPAGSTSTTLSLNIIDDTIREPDENIIITLSNPINADLGNNNTFIYTILDNEPRVRGVNIQSWSTEAIVSWATEEAGSSIVEYGTTTPPAEGAYNFSESKQELVLDHKIYLTNLTPNTTYYLRVKSVKADGQEIIDDNQGRGYSFTTNNGPVISNVQITDFTDTSAKINWTTDKPSNSTVYYSTSSDLSRVNRVSSNDLVTSHTITLTNLQPLTTYYFKVESIDTENNIGISTNRGNYYTFTTLDDMTPPEISDVRVLLQTSKLLVITWQTNEPADGQIEYGTQQGVYSSSTEISPYLSTFHAFTLSGLSPRTTYYFRIKSKDAMNNLAVSQEYTASTTAEEAKLITQTVYLGVSTEQYNQLKADYDKLQQEAQKMKQELEKLQDKTPPEISNIEIKNVQPFSATVCFRTNEPAIGIVQYGEEKGKYPYSVSEDDYLTSHCLELKRLKMGTKYYLRIIAIDRSGNRGIKTTK
jgi:alpha-tubulin suppressor-like RCC1 family protein